MYMHHVYDKMAAILSYTPGSAWGTEDGFTFSHNEPCRIRPLSGGERFAGDKETVIATHRVYCPVTDITEADRIEIDTVGYKVSLVSRPSASDHLEIDVLKIK